MLGTSYKAEVFESEFGDGSKLGLQIEYVVEDEPLGTGGGIANVASKLRHDTALVFNGDVLSGADLRALLDSHRRTTAPMSPCTWCASAIRAHSAACPPMPTAW